MSVLFPQVNKPPKWNFRPRYYDPEKDKRAQKLAKLQKERAAQEGNEENAKVTSGHSLHRGSFREAKDAYSSQYTARRTSRLAFWIALFVMLIAFLYVIL